MSSSTNNNAPIPLLDINAGNAPLLEEMKQKINAVCDSGRFLFGPEVKELETAVAEVTGAKHAIGCASGSDALLLALMARGIGPGDEVITPSFTFFATASAVWRLGATPVFVDIDPSSFNIDTEKVADAVTRSTKAIIPVHLFGQCANMDEINDIADEHNLFVIEDAAQAIAAGYGKKHAGNLGDVACFSFYPTKNLGGLGDGGMLTTSCDDLATKLRVYAAHGMEPRYYHSVVGINSRLDSIQAAGLVVKIGHLAEATAARRANADHYGELFEASDLGHLVKLPTESPGNTHVWNQYTIRVGRGQRDNLRAHLANEKIGSEIYYPLPLHQQECFKSLGATGGDLHETDRAAKEVLSLPVYPEMTAEQRERVVGSITRFAQNQRAKAA